MTLRPTPPTPKTAAVSPGRTRARLSTAPTPVRTPQPMRQADVSGTSFGILTAWTSWTTVDSAKTDAAAKLYAGCPLNVNGVSMLPERPAAPGRVPGAARPAGAAVGQGGDDDVVADLDRTDLGADRLDDAGPLVAEDDRRRERDRPVDDRQVGVADPGRPDPHPDLLGPGVADRQLLGDLHAVGGVDDPSHGHLLLSYVVDRSDPVDEPLPEVPLQDLADRIGRQRVDDDRVPGNLVVGHRLPRPRQHAVGRNRPGRPRS